MRIRRSLAVVAASVALAVQAAACSGGSSGSPLAPDANGPEVPAPRDTSGTAMPNGGMGG